MNLRIMLAGAAILVAPAAFAQNTQNSTPGNTPGHQMQDKGSKPGTTGASGYSPGHQMQDKGSKPGSPGASGYAPGQQDKTSGSSNRK
jgi:hypothetical protein